MNAQPTDLLRQAQELSESVVQPIVGSRKIYLEGSRPDLRVPMREIALANTAKVFGTEINAPFCVYDTSGPYTDPEATIDLGAGLAPLRAAWIEERGDSEQLSAQSSEFGRGRNTDARLDPVRFAHPRLPRRAKSGANVSQMHYARRGIITPEMEFIAIRENQRIEAIREAHLLQQHAGESFGANIQKLITPEFVRSEVARPRHHPAHPPPPRARADDQRPQLPDQGQREHW